MSIKPIKESLMRTKPMVTQYKYSNYGHSVQVLNLWSLSASTQPMVTQCNYSNYGHSMQVSFNEY